MSRIFVLLLLWVSPALSQDRGLIAVPYADLQQRLLAVIDFESFPKTISPGIALDAVQRFDGAALAERFAGQAVEQQDGFDILTGVPVAPLHLMAGSGGRNLAVAFHYYLTNQLSGLAPPGYPDPFAGGEGAIAILFDRNQAAFGMRITAEPAPKDASIPKGRITLTAYRRDASLIDQLEIALDWDRAGYGFRRIGDAPDIAGVTITNRDPAGIAIDDILFDVTQVTGRLYWR